MSDSLVRIFEDFPIVGIVIFTLYYVQRQQREENATTYARLEKMLETQRSSLKDAYDSQNAFLATLLTQIEAKQNSMADRIELLAQQIAVNTSTVSEIAKVDAVVSDLLDRLEHK